MSAGNHVVKYPITYRNIDYIVILQKPREMRMVMYLSEYFFYASLKAPSALKHFYLNNGSPGKFMQTQIDQCRVIRIEKKMTIEASIFKAGLELTLMPQIIEEHI